MAEFYTHLQGSEQLRCSHLAAVSLGYRQAHCPFTRQLAINSSFLATLAQTTTHHPPPCITFLALSKQASLFDTPFTIADTSLEFTYGITSTTASFIYLTNKFWQCAHCSDAAGVPDSNELSDAIQTLACLINAWTPLSEPFTSISADDTASLAIVRNLALSFNYAARIYFHSCFTLESPPSNWPTCAELSTLTLMALEEAECDKDAASRTLKLNVKGASISWPAFVAACVAPTELRPRWSKYWEVLMNYRIGNLRVVWGIVKNIWRTTDTKAALEIADDMHLLHNDVKHVRLNKPRWSEVLADVGFSILAV